MKTTEERLAEICRRGKQKIMQRNRRIKAAAFCIPLVLSVGFGAMMLWHQGTPTAIPAQTQSTEETAKTVTLTSYVLCVEGAGMEVVHTDAARIDVVQSILSGIDVEYKSSEDVAVQQADESAHIQRGEEAAYIITLTGEDGESRQYRLQGFVLRDCLEDKQYCLTVQQYWKLREALGISDG